MTMAWNDPNRTDWTAAWRLSLQKLRSSGMRTLSFSSLIRRLDPNRFNGMDRWMVKGVKKRLGSAMSVMLYDMVRFAWALMSCIDALVSRALAEPSISHSM